MGPSALDAVESLVKALEAGNYNAAPGKLTQGAGTYGFDTEFRERPLKKAVDRSKYPHDCDCGAPCYNSGFSIKCSSKACQHYEAS